jgi:hypothetical protein
MGIRRRRKRLTSLMSRLDQRVRSVELRPISLLTSSDVDAAITIGEASAGPETIVSSSAPYQFRKIEDAYVYPKALTGLSEDRVEVYLESDISAAVGERIEISGIHGTSTEDIDVDGDAFTIKSIDTPPYSTGRASYKHDPTQDQRTGVTITNTYSFKPDTVAPPTWSTRKRLQTKRRVDDYSIAGSTVTLNMNAVHKFQVGNVIFVGIFSESSIAYGADGLAAVTAVTGTTIEYELSAGVDTPTGTLTPSTDVYVFPVAREWAQDGSIWIDSSSNTTYYWDGIRWVEYTPSTSLGADGDPPAPPTNFSVSDTASTYGPYFTAYSKVTLSWTAPTLTSEGDALTDLLGYKIQWRDSPTAEWKELLVNNSALTTYVFDQEVNLQQGQTYYFRLYAYDSGNQDSTAATATHATAFKAGDHTTYPPTDPIATSRLGTIKVVWDGRLKTGPSTSIAAPSDVSVLRIYVSTVPGFITSSANLAASTRVFANNNGGFDILTDLTYGTTYYIKIRVADTAGVESGPSAQVAAQVNALVDTDLIGATLATWPFNGGVIPVGALASGAINASNLFGNDVIVQSAIAAGAIGANEIAAGAIIAGKIGADAITATNIQAGSIDAGKISANAITAIKIDVGAITAEKIDVGAITADKIEAGSITADKLQSNFILGNLIATGAQGSERIEIRGANQANPGIVSFDGTGGTAFRFYADGRNYIDGDLTIESGGTLTVNGSVTGGTFTGGSFTGGTFVTSSGTGKRVLVSGSSNAVKFYQSGDSSGSPRGTLEGNNNGVYLRGPAESTTDYLYISSNFTRLGQGGNTLTLSSTGLNLTNIQSDTTAYSDVKYNTNTNTLFILSSDRRLKSDITSLEDGLSIVNRLNPVSFKSKYSDPDTTNHGFIAQEVEEVFNDESLNMVGKLNNPSIAGYTGDISEFDGDPLRSFSSGELIPILTKAIQDLSAKNDALEARIAALEAK